MSLHEIIIEIRRVKVEFRKALEESTGKAEEIAKKKLSKMLQRI